MNGREAFEKSELEFFKYEARKLTDYLRDHRKIKYYNPKTGHGFNNNDRAIEDIPEKEWSTLKLGERKDYLSIDDPRLIMELAEQIMGNNDSAEKILKQTWGKEIVAEIAQLKEKGATHYNIKTGAAVKLASPIETFTQEQWAQARFPGEIQDYMLIDNPNIEAKYIELGLEEFRK